MRPRLETALPATRRDPLRRPLHRSIHTLMKTNRGRKRSKRSQRDWLVYDKILGYRLADVTGRYINIAAEERTSYGPLATDEPPIEVWYFGGSAMFGISQHNEHAIPSEIAKLAEHDGISVRTRNFAVPADTNWQETIRLAERLQREPGVRLSSSRTTEQTTQRLHGVTLRRSVFHRHSTASHHASRGRAFQCSI